jgi:hypothetical protein
MLSPVSNHHRFLSGQLVQANAQARRRSLDYLVSLRATACALGLKEADLLHQAPATPAARFLRAPASRGCFVLRIATHSFPCDAGTLVPSDAGTPGPCGTPAFWDNKDPKAATRAKRRSNPAPTSVLQGGNDASRQI